MRQACSITVVLSILAAPAHAQWVVTELADATAVNPFVSPDTNLGIPGEQITLRSAIQHINTLPPGSYTIVLPAGDILLGIAGHAENNAVTGDLDVLRSIRITGNGLGSTFIRAGALGDRAFDVRTPVVLSLSKLGVYGGTAVPGVAGVETGGAVRGVAGSTIELFETEFSGNQALGGANAHGGAIDTAGSVTMAVWNMFYQNFSAGSGGAMRVGGAATVKDSVFQENRAAVTGGAVRTLGGGPGSSFEQTRFGENDAQGTGGALDLRAPALVRDCVLEGNESFAVGGAMGVQAPVSVEACVLRRNRSNSGGGAVNVAAGGVLTVVDTLMEANTAATSGGAITNSSICRVHFSTLAGNIADGPAAAELGGGAIYNFGNLEMVNSTVSLNAAPNGLGGGILNLTGGNANLSHVTIAENRALAGDSIVNGTPGGGAVMRMTHTIVSNIPSAGSSVAGLSLPLISLGFNLDSDGTAGLGGPGDLAGTLLVPLNPLLSPLGMHGGPTPTHTLQSASPALNGGDAAFSVDPSGAVVVEDQRHEPRPQGRPDMGAVEVRCAADFAPPFGVLNFFDVAAYLNAYANQDPAADLAAPFGVWDFFDLAAFLSAFGSGC